MGCWSRIITSNNLLDKTDSHSLTYIWSTYTELKGIYPTSDLRASQKFLIEITKVTLHLLNQRDNKLHPIRTIPHFETRSHKLSTPFTLKYFQHNPHAAFLHFMIFFVPNALQFPLLPKSQFSRMLCTSACRACADFGRPSQLNPRALCGTGGGVAQRTIGTTVKPLGYGVPMAAGFWLAVDHPAQAQPETAPQLPFGVANFSSGDFPHIYEQLHGICSPLKLPRRHDDKISFPSTTVFIYDTLSFGTAFHNSSQENASQKSAYVFISTQPFRQKLVILLCFFIHDIKVFKVRSKSNTAR